MQYWKWLFRGLNGSKPGVNRFLDRWLLLHLFLGIALANIVPISLSEAARVALLPLAGIFIGLSFAWGGNANAILQTTEILEVSKYHKGGLSEYVYVYSTAILVLLACVCLWGLAAFEIFDTAWPSTQSRSYLYVAAVAYGFSSLALRECWQVVVGTQYLLLTRAGVKDAAEGGNVTDDEAQP